MDMLLQILVMVIAASVQCHTPGCSYRPVLSLELVENTPNPVLRCGFCHSNFVQPRGLFNITWTLNGKTLARHTRVKEQQDLHVWNFRNLKPYGLWTCRLENQRDIHAKYNLRPNTAIRPTEVHENTRCPTYPTLSIYVVTNRSSAELLCSFCHKDLVQPKRIFTFTWKLNRTKIDQRATARRVLNLSDPTVYGLWTCSLDYYVDINAKYDLRPNTSGTLGEANVDTDVTFPQRLLVTMITVIVLIILLTIIGGMALACYLMQQYRKTPRHRPETRERSSGKASLKEDLRPETRNQDTKTDEGDNVSYIELQLETKPQSRNLNHCSTVYASIV